MRKPISVITVAILSISGLVAQATAASATPSSGVTVGIGNNHMAALDANGKVWTWGVLKPGQNGSNSVVSEFEPVEVLVTGKTTFKDVDAVCDSNVAVASDGTVWSWGLSGNGLGDAANTNSSPYTSPVRVSIPGGKAIHRISSDGCGYSAVATDGSVYQWGNGWYSNSTPRLSMTVPVPGDLATLDVFRTGWGATFVRSGNTMYAQGDASSGKLGNGSTSTTFSGGYPAQTTVINPSGRYFTKVVGNSQFNIGLADNGSVYGWGGNDQGQIDGKRKTNSTISSSSSPIQILNGSSALQGIVDVSVSESEPFVTALRSDGTAVAWGGWNNDNMVLHEVGSVGSANSSTSIPQRHVTNIWTRNNAKVALSSDGTLWAKGSGWWMGNSSNAMDGNCGQDASDWSYWDNRKHKNMPANPLVRVASNGSNFGPAFSPDAITLDSLKVNNQTLDTQSIPAVTMRNGGEVSIEVTGVTSNCFDPSELSLEIESGLSNQAESISVNADGTANLTFSVTNVITKQTLNLKVVNPNNYEELFPIKFNVLPAVSGGNSGSTEPLNFPIISTNPRRDTTFAVTEAGDVYVWGTGWVAKRFLGPSDPVGIPVKIENPLVEADGVTPVATSVKLRGVSKTKKWCFSDSCNVGVNFAWATDGRLYVLRGTKFVASRDYLKGGGSVLADYEVNKVIGPFIVATKKSDHLKTILEFVRYESSNSPSFNDHIPSYKWEVSRLLGDPSGVTPSIIDAWSAGTYDETRMVFQTEDHIIHDSGGIFEQASYRYNCQGMYMNGSCTQGRWIFDRGWREGPYDLVHLSEIDPIQVTAAGWDNAFFAISLDSNGDRILSFVSGRTGSLTPISIGSGVRPVSIAGINVGRNRGNTWYSGTQVLGSDGEMYAVTTDGTVTVVEHPQEMGAIRGVGGNGHYSIGSDGSIWTTPVDEMILNDNGRAPADGNCVSSLVPAGETQTAPVHVVSDGNLGPEYHADTFGFNVTAETTAFESNRDDLSTGSRTISVRPDHLNEANLFAYASSACKPNVPVQFSWDLNNDGTYGDAAEGENSGSGDAINTRANSFISKESSSRAEGGNKIDDLNGWSQSIESLPVESAEGKQISVRVHSDYGDADYSIAVVGTPLPPARRVGISINGGARYTTSNDVELSIGWPDGAVQALISNDGGFESATQVPLQEKIRWKLDADESSKSSAVVYIRFLSIWLNDSGNWDSWSYGDQVPTTLSDNITADLTPPEVSSVVATVASLEVMSLGISSKAKVVALSEVGQLATINIDGSDGVSGITGMQVTDDPAVPGAVLPYTSTASISVSNNSAAVRLKDAAGNWSPWKQTTIRNFVNSAPNIDPVTPPSGGGNGGEQNLNPVPSGSQVSVPTLGQQAPGTAIPATAKAKKKLTVSAKTATGIPIRVTVSGGCKVKANTKTVKSKVGKKTVKSKVIVSYSVTMGKKNTSCSITQSNNGGNGLAPLNSVSTVSVK